jgi:hypothetical protein
MPHGLQGAADMEWNLAHDQAHRDVGLWLCGTTAATAAAAGARDRGGSAVQRWGGQGDVPAAVQGASALDGCVAHDQAGDHVRLQLRGSASAAPGDLDRGNGADPEQCGCKEEVCEGLQGTADVERRVALDQTRQGCELRLHRTTVTDNGTNEDAGNNARDDAEALTGGAGSHRIRCRAGSRAIRGTERPRCAIEHARPVVGEKAHELGRGVAHEHAVTPGGSRQRGEQRHDGQLFGPVPRTE